MRMNRGKIKKGSLLLSSRPFVYILGKNKRTKHCEFCFQGINTVFRCSSCRYVYYCNRECQKLAWIDHKRECINIRNVSPNYPTDSLRFLARIILKLQRPEGRMEFEKVGPYTRSFKDLMSHEEEIKNDTKMSKEIPVFIMGLKLFIGEENLPPYNEIVDIFGKMVVNSYCIYSGDLQEIGTGLYLGASFFDHSCEPNAAVTFNGPTLYVRTLQDMDELDYKRIFISYIDQMATTKERQRSLKEQYFFVCQCYRCNDPKLDILMTKTMKCATEEDVTKVTEESKRTVELLAKKKKENDAPSTILEICKHCLSQQEGVLDPSNVLCVKILDQAFDASISLGKWEEAIDFSLATLEPYRLYYGNYHPNLGIQLFRIGKIELFMERLNAAKKMLLQAEKVIAVTHGTKHPIYQDLLKLIDQCQEELNIRKLKNISV